MCSKLVVHTKGLIAESLRFLPKPQSRKTRLFCGSSMFSGWRLFISASVYIQMGGAEPSQGLSHDFSCIAGANYFSTLNVRVQLLRCTLFFNRPFKKNKYRTFICICPYGPCVFALCLFKGFASD